MSVIFVRLGTAKTPLWSLSVLVDDAVNDPKSIEVELDSLTGAIRNHLVLLVEVIEKC
mgnify:CR=1 FL=1